MQIKVGEKAPAFTLPNQDDKETSLSDYAGKWVVLYFYPKDDTPGCTTEACGFTDGIKDLEGLKAVVLGCSPDSPESHRKFIEKYKLKFTLLSDPDRKVMEPYGGSVSGHTVRSTVLINPDGVVAYHWPKVNPKGHMEEVKAKLEELQK
ncbi:MAG: redoxin domain-containing protein [Planctomycetes bacterium]|nr:redoxin domain-containing protein [Planctomycetota bacterium]